MSVRPTKPSTYNRQGHVLARDNRHQPYPSQSQIRDRVVKNQHHLEKYQDVFMMDHIWAAQETWRNRLWSIEMSVFQEALISRGPKEHPDEEDAMLTCMLYPLGYLVVLAAECLEAIDTVSEEAIQFDLLVGSLVGVSCGEANQLPCSIIRIPSRGRRLRRSLRRSWSGWSARGSVVTKTSVRRSRSWRSRDVGTSGPSLV